MVEWIDVRKGLPKDGQRVMTFCPSCADKISFHTHRERFKGAGAWWLGPPSHLVSAQYVTRWATVPNAPQEEA